ncbi:MAG: hypothetical protein QG614_115 [Patescibacteria group bacterium]|nr:hypothetical protein [Patescibacteria group bacterium]
MIFNSKKPTLHICCGTLSYPLYTEINSLGVKIFSYDIFRDRAVKDVEYNNFYLTNSLKWNEKIIRYLCHKTMADYLLNGRDIAFQTSLPPSLARLWAIRTFIFTAYKIVIHDCRMTRKEAKKHVRKLNDNQITMITPYYFKYNTSPEFVRFTVGPERARAVLLSELSRYPCWKFLRKNFL